MGGWLHITRMGCCMTHKIASCERPPTLPSSRPLPLHIYITFSVTLVHLPFCYVLIFISIQLCPRVAHSILPLWLYTHILGCHACRYMLKCSAYCEILQLQPTTLKIARIANAVPFHSSSKNHTDSSRLKRFISVRSGTFCNSTSQT